MPEPKDNFDDMITVKVTKKTLREAHIMAREYEHTNLSNLVRQFVGRKIDAAKEKRPDLFKQEPERANRVVVTAKSKGAKSKGKQVKQNKN